MRNARVLFPGEPFVDPLRPRLQRKPFVVDVGGAIEIIGSQDFQPDLGSFALLCHDTAAGQRETTKSCNDNQGLPTQSDPIPCHQTLPSAVSGTVRLSVSTPVPRPKRR